jgi:hypothetical protein
MANSPMSLVATRRIIRHQLGQTTLREKYWASHRYLGLLQGLLARSNRAYARHVARDYTRFLTNGVVPVPGETLERARAAVAWLERAQDATPDDGVSLGYFPCGPGAVRGWRASYPETTGYIISSLLDFARVAGDDGVRQRALRMAQWEIRTQLPSGAVQAGMVCLPGEQRAAVFNTGMVLHGYTSAFRETRDVEILAAARRAGDFLVADQGEDGHFRTHGPNVAQHQIKTYNCLCAWGLYRLGQDTGEHRYCESALRAVAAAVGQQRPNGWLANNCLTNPNAPLLHTIGYALQGILEVGALAGREDFVEAAQLGLDPILDRMLPNGFLHGCFDADWSPAVFSSCLTGNAQVAVVAYRMFELTGRPHYRDRADRLVDFLKALQAVDSQVPGVDGAIPGSFPMLGSYMSAAYPNWATKFFLDALLGQHRLRGA